MRLRTVGVFSPITAKIYSNQRGEARLPDWATKFHVAPGNVVSNPAVVPTAPVPSVIDPSSIVNVSNFHFNKILNASLQNYSLLKLRAASKYSPNKGACKNLNFSCDERLQTTETR